MKTIFLHYRSFILALAKIIKNPFEHLLNILTLSVIITALCSKNPFEHLLNILTLSVIITALCSILVIGKNINHWQKNNINFPQIIVYMKENANTTNISTIEETINKFNSKIIRNYRFISKEQGLKELQQDQSLKQIASDVINNNQNPIPDVLIINTNTTDNHYLLMLKEKISKLDMVDEVQMDTNYASKIESLGDFVGSISNWLQIAFSIILVIVTYNMIRLQMLLRQDEIIVSRLIGAADSFIMRPLAYYAVLQIVIAAGIALFIVDIFIRFTNNIFAELSNLFGQNFMLTPLDNLQIAQIIGILIIFGIFAVFLAVRWVFRNSYVA